MQTENMMQKQKTKKLKPKIKDIKFPFKHFQNKVNSAHFSTSSSPSSSLAELPAVVTRFGVWEVLLTWVKRTLITVVG